MYPHHERALQKVKAHFEQDPTVLALLFSGSLAKGWGSESSDVDIMLIVTEEEFARRTLNNEYLYFSTDFTDYEGGYVDGKFLSVSFLEEIAAHGSEVARAAFYAAQIVFSRLPDLDQLIARIPVYPEAERDAKLKAFYSQMMVFGWFFMREADKRGDKYLTTRAAADLVLFASRLILAYNHMLYPYHKWLMHEIERAPEKPENFAGLIQALLDAPSPATADALIEAINAFHDWGVPFAEVFVRFLNDSEWDWRDYGSGHRTPIGDW